MLIYRNNDLLLLNLENKYILSDLLKLDRDGVKLPNFMGY